MFSRLIPILLFLLPTVAVMGQEIVSSPVKRKLQWGITTSLDYTNRVLTNKTNDPDYDDIISLYNRLEIGSIGYTAGVTMQANLHPRLILNTGLTYSRQGHQTTLREAQWPSEVENGEYNPDPNLDGSFKDLSRFCYANLPLSLRYYISPNKRWFISGGLTTNLLLKATSVLIWKEDGNTDRTKSVRSGDFASFNLSPEIGFGKEFQLHNHTSLHIAPVFRYGLIPVYSHKIAENTWSAGLAMRLLFGA